MAETVQTRLDADLAERLKALAPVYGSPRNALEAAARLLLEPAGPEATSALGLDRRVLFPVGNDAIREALECWAACLREAGEALAGRFAPEEWCLLADVLNGCMIDHRWSSPGLLLAAEVEDGHRLDGTGYRWLGTEGTELEGSALRLGLARGTPDTARVDEQVADLLSRLRDLSFVEGWAVVQAVRWFWERSGEDFDVRSDPWWSPRWRFRFDHPQPETRHA